MERLSYLKKKTMNWQSNTENKNEKNCPFLFFFFYGNELHWDQASDVTINSYFK